VLTAHDDKEEGDARHPSAQERPFNAIDRAPGVAPHGQLSSLPTGAE
jgi:hypothetical protein